MKPRIWKRNGRWTFEVWTGPHEVAVFVNPSWEGAMKCFESFRTGKMANCDYVASRVA